MKYIIYKSNLKTREVIGFKRQDIALASLYLQVTVAEINGLLSTCSLLTERQYKARIVSKLMVKAMQAFQVYEDNTVIVLSDRLDWLTVMLIYVLSTTPVPEIDTTVLTLMKFASKKYDLLKNYQSFYNSVATSWVEMYNKYNSVYFNYFNYTQLKQVYKEMNIKSYHFNELGNLVIRWEDIDIKNKRDEVLHYDSIILEVTKTFFIKNFQLNFHTIPYSSDWGFPIVLHPNLNSKNLGYGRNNYLEFLPLRDMKIVMEALNEVVTCPDVESQEFAEVYEQYIGIVRLWKDLSHIENEEERIRILSEIH